jgi:hypothetical protein
MYERVPLFLEVVNHEEYVKVEVESGEVIGTKPIEGSGTAFLHLRAPDGTVVRAEIPHERLDDFLALMFPQDFAADHGQAVE